jgi:serine/threonine-protein kinase RsbT
MAVPIHEHERRVRISGDLDLVTARQVGRQLALQLGFSTGEATLVATAISELARNILRYAQHGEILLYGTNGAGVTGIRVVAQDPGPGIADVEAALRPGVSTSGGLGLGLPGVRRIMDEFQIDSATGRGTRVMVTKWKR